MATSSAKQSLKNRAYSSIKNKILTCAYAPGEFLNEQQLCAELNDISRTPVRDALSRLEQEGLVCIRPKKGTVVTDVSLDDVNHIYEVRLMIEPYALRRYGQNLSAERILEFSEIMKDSARAHQDTAYFNAQDDAFHAMIVEALPNPYLKAAYDTVSELNVRFRALCGHHGMSRIDATYIEHSAILQACLSGDWNAAADAMVHHLELGREATYEGVLRQKQAAEKAEK